MIFFHECIQPKEERPKEDSVRTAKLPESTGEKPQQDSVRTAKLLGSAEGKSKEEATQQSQQGSTEKAVSTGEKASFQCSAEGKNIENCILATARERADSKTPRFCGRQVEGRSNTTVATRKYREGCPYWRKIKGGGETTVAAREYRKGCTY
ncbi:hypothetical protein GCK32_017658 [Trichostrongylus colubriformis]|uniref:Uncharacterized protein n=1 Tax=Trichostrongylus colubriformis TaxID=6319 RepID=A0AAN8IQG3_TRICO